MQSRIAPVIVPRVMPTSTATSMPTKRLPV